MGEFFYVSLSHLVEANAMNSSASFSFTHDIACEELIFEYFSQI